MATDRIDRVEITAQCLCKVNTFTTSVPQSDLPLPGSICHCTSCRHVSGAMYTSDVVWPGPINNVLASNLSRYAHTANVTLLFCGTCSSPMFWWEHHHGQPEVLDVLTGVLQNQESVLVRFTHQKFVGDTVDGGASPWLQRLNVDGGKLQCWKHQAGKSEQLDTDWPPMDDLPKAEDKTGPETYPIRCHCRGVDLVLRRGDAEFAAMQAESLPFFIEPTTHKHLASFDSCNSCRSMFGVDIVNWAFCLLHQLDFAASAGESGFPRSTPELKGAVSSPDRDPHLGTLAMYESSPDVQRYFCSRCSASVFYAVDDRPDLVDVAVGLLGAPEGARAESLLVWSLGSKVGGEEDVAGGWREGIVQSVRGTAEDWRIRRDYPKTWRRLALERSNHP
ncbi:hypothetical protein ACJ41O_012956 [Fusarium nematophilum]